MSEHVESRRAFTKHALQSLTAVALLEGLAARRLFGADVQPVVDTWLAELNAISRDVRDHRVKDVEFTRSLEALYRRADLNTLLRTLDFERIVPGHGPVVPKSYLDVQRSVLLAWKSAVATAIAKGWTRDETIERVGFKDEFGPVDIGQGYMLDYIQSRNAAALSTPPPVRT